MIITIVVGGSPYESVQIFEVHCSVGSMIMHQNNEGNTQKCEGRKEWRR